MNPYEYLAKILEVSEDLLSRLDQAMAARTGIQEVFERVAAENERHADAALAALGASGKPVPRVREILRNAVLDHERELTAFMKEEQGETEFEKAAHLAGRIAGMKKGLFLKKEFAKDILRKRRPENLLKFLGASDIEKVFEKSGVMEAFSALRFVESDQWMHETFDAAYGNFTQADFEERDIEVKVLGPEWSEIALKFIAKKHHNVSHLKEFGIIFINPISENVPGKFLRDFALLLHYIHEIEFYSKLFKRYSRGQDFAERLKALLRGDVKEVGEGSPAQISPHETWAGNWLIVQRYLFKENPNDPRLYLPRVNPESMHWARGERDLARFAGQEGLGAGMWGDLDWVATFADGAILSFDLEDNAMTAVSHGEGNQENFRYHQREALWTRMFREYAGGEEEMEKLLVENFSAGTVKF